MLLFSLEKMNSELQLIINYPASLSSNPLFFEEYAKFLRSIRELSEQKTPSTPTGCKVTQSPQVVLREAIHEAGRNMTLPSPNTTIPVRDVKKTSYRRRREGPTLNREVPIVSPNTGFAPIQAGDLKDSCSREDIKCPCSREDFFDKVLFGELEVCTIRSGLQLWKGFVVLFFEKYLSKEQSEKVFGFLLEALEIIEIRKLFSINKIVKDTDVRSALLKVILI